MTKNQTRCPKCFEEITYYPNNTTSNSEIKVKCKCCNKKFRIKIKQPEFNENDRE